MKTNVILGLILFGLLKPGDALTKKETLYAENDFKYFASPLYPHDFPAQTQYSWRIIAGLLDSILIEFTEFSLQEADEHGKCIGQAVILADGEYNRHPQEPSTSKILKFCGREKPPVVQSTGREVTIALDSDSGGQGEYPQNFVVRYKIVKRYRPPPAPAYSSPGNARPRRPTAIGRPILPRDSGGGNGYLGDIIAGRRRWRPTRKTTTAVTTTPWAPRKKFRIPEHIKIMLYVLIPVITVFVAASVAMKRRRRYNKRNKAEKKNKESTKKNGGNNEEPIYAIAL